MADMAKELREINAGISLLRNEVKEQNSVISNLYLLQFLAITSMVRK
jgi:hypothetical protein